jgi:hypothetical protein
MFMMSYIDTAIVLPMFMLLYIDTSIVLPMFMMSFIFVICKMWSFEWKRNVCMFCLSFVYICIAVGDPIIKCGRLITVTGLTPSHIVPVPCHYLDFQCYMPWLFFYVQRIVVRGDRSFG